MARQLWDESWAVAILRVAVTKLAVLVPDIDTGQKLQKSKIPLNPRIGDLWFEILLKTILQQAHICITL